MAKTTTEFLDGLKKRITYPANQELLTTVDLLRGASELLRLGITKTIKASRQNYLLATATIPVIANQQFYDVPYRSVVNGLEDIKWTQSENSQYYDMAYLRVEDLDKYLFQASNPYGFYFQADQIGLAPIPAADSGLLKLWYHRRLSNLCQPSQAGQVTNINGNIVTLDNLPETFVPGFEIDFIKSKSMPVILDQDQQITNVAGTQLTFLSVPSRLVVGDWIAPANFTPIIPLMDEGFRYFEGAAGIYILNSIGDFEGSKRLDDEEFKQDEKDFKSLLEPRIDGEPEKVVNYHNLLRQKSTRSFGFFRR